MRTADFFSPPSMVALLAAAAALVSLRLFRAALGGGSLPGCGAGSGCDAVARSRWSRWGRVPVAGPGAVVYLVVALAAVAANPAAPPAAQRIGWATLALLAPLVVGAALWFMALQLLVLRRLCAYCTLAHAAALAAGTVCLAAGPVPPAGRTALLGSGGAALLLLIGGQVFVRPRLYAVVETTGRARRPPSPATGSTSDQPPAVNGSAGGGPAGGAGSGVGRPPAAKRDRQVVALGGKVALSTAGWPLLGEADAPHVAVYLFDYTCPECRRLHRLLGQAVLRYAGGLAVLCVPVPADPACNPTVRRREAMHAYACAYARLGLALWAADPARYAEYDRWLFEPDRPPPLGLALAKARELAPALSGFEPDVPDAEIEPRLRSAVEAFSSAGTGKIPTLLFPRGAVFGRIAGEAELLGVVAQQVGIAPPRAVQRAGV